MLPVLPPVVAPASQVLDVCPCFPVGSLTSVVCHYLLPVLCDSHSKSR